MPALPYYFNSTFYLVKMNWVQYFLDLGIDTRTVSGYVYFVASKFERKLENSASKKTYVQGKPGNAVQNVPTPYYVYTIEAPLIINNFTYGANIAFAPYNSLNYFAMQMANFQWASLHGYASALTPLNNIALKKFEIKATESGVMQTMEFWSTEELSSDFIGAYTLPQVTDPNIVSQFTGRVVRNYDIYSNLEINPIFVPGTAELTPYYLQSNANDIFLDSCNFAINFDIDVKYFINTGNVVTFVLKNYDITQSYGITGFAYIPITDNFEPGEFHYRDTINTVLLGPSANGNCILQTQLPMIVKSKALNFNEGQLLTTVFDFSFYASQYNNNFTNGNNGLIYWNFNGLS